MSALPEQAVDPMVLDHIRSQMASAPHWDADHFPCGCQMILDPVRWRLCRYHDGMNDGLAMADPDNRSTTDG